MPNAPTHSPECPVEERPEAGLVDLDKDNPRPKVAVFHSERKRCWGPLAVDVVRRDAGEAICRSTCHRLTFLLSDFHGTMADDERPPWDCRLMRGSFVYRPPDTTLCARVTSGRYIQILQSRETYDNLAMQMVRGGVLRLEPRYAAEDPLVAQLVATIAHEIAGGVFDHILADALNTALAVRIVRCIAEPAAFATAVANGLSGERLRRVRDYIETHLADPLNLEKIADIACLSPYHFCRSFKQATGVTPHRYVVQRRLERAKSLMRRTDRPLGLIAQDAGFTDQSHLTAVFRREIGLTPGRFRLAVA
jgi:AraC-like DNA-binding protein